MPKEYLTACGHGIQPFDDHKIIIIDYNDSKTTNRTTTSSDVIKSSDEVLVSFQAKGLTDSFFRDCAKCRRSLEKNKFIIFLPSPNKIKVQKQIKSIKESITIYNIIITQLEYLTACGHGIQPFDDHKIIIIDYNDSKTTNRTTTSSDVIKSSDEVLVSFQAKGLTDSFFRDCAKCRRSLGEFIGQNYKDDKITNMVENIIRTYGLEIMR
ncbi:5582_t:CDS:2 [Entrophospora sp. SA101]|nr:5582_t:CDS:2 [Entrophospora sp. SA101]